MPTLHLIFAKVRCLAQLPLAGLLGLSRLQATRQDEAPRPPVCARSTGCASCCMGS